MAHGPSSGRWPRNWNALITCRAPYKDAAGDVGVLSACRDLTIWYIQPLGDLLRWQETGTEITWPASDIGGAAARLAVRCRELLASAPSGPP